MYAVPVIVNFGCCKARTDFGQFTVTIYIAVQVNRSEESAETISSFFRINIYLSFSFYNIYLQEINKLSLLLGRGGGETPTEVISGIYIHIFSSFSLSFE